MDADWYVDPLGRFDGRFFDGERWTEQVSDAGRVAIDPDFPPATQRRRTARTDLPAADIVESPVRVVAVLEDPGTGRGGAGGGRLVRTALVALTAVLVVVGFVALRARDDGGSTAASVDLDPEDAARVEDLASGGQEDDTGEGGDVPEALDVDAPEATVPDAATFAAEEIIEVGALRVLNGASVLEELGEWHVGFSESRRILLAEDAGCWFGQLGGAAVQEVYCGPIGSSGETDDARYDQIPVVFEDADASGVRTQAGQIAQPVVDAVAPGVVLPNALTLIGPDGPVAPD